MYAALHDSHRRPGYPEPDVQTRTYKDGVRVKNPPEKEGNAAKRLLNLESGWTKVGGGWQGRKDGRNRNKKKARAHKSRLERLREKAGQ